MKFKISFAIFIFIILIGMASVGASDIVDSSHNLSLSSDVDIADSSQDFSVGNFGDIADSSQDIFQSDESDSVISDDETIDDLSSDRENTGGENTGGENTDEETEVFINIEYIEDDSSSSMGDNGNDNLEENTYLGDGNNLGDVASFTALNLLIQNNLMTLGHLELINDYAFDRKTDQSLVFGVTIANLLNPNAVIDGNGHRIDGLQLAALFNVVSTNMTFRNLIFTNVGFSDDMRECYEREAPQGVSDIKDLFNAVHITQSKVKFVNCTFINNQCPKYGSIYASMQSQIEIINCRFINNNANYGAALTSDLLSSLDIQKSNFTNNHAISDGGAIYIQDSAIEDEKIQIVYECSFTNNHAISDGGAIFTESQSTQVQIFSSRFNSNNATVGGAVYLDCPFLFSYCNFTSNTADKAAGAYLTNLKAIMTDMENNLNGFTGCIFKNNDATESCSDLYLQNEISDEGSYIIKSNYFSQKSRFIPSVLFVNQYSGVDFNFSQNSFVAAYNYYSDTVVMKINTEGSVTFNNNWWGIAGPQISTIKVRLNDVDCWLDQSPIYFELHPAKNIINNSELNIEMEYLLLVFEGRPGLGNIVNFVPYGIEPIVSSTDGIVRYEPHGSKVYFTPNKYGRLHFYVQIDNARMTKTVNCTKDSNWKTLIWTSAIMAVPITLVVSGMIALFNSDSPNHSLTIQEAVDFAEDDYAIMLKPGIYRGLGNVGLIIKKNLTLMTDPDETGDVIIDAEGNSQIFNILASRFNVLGIKFINGHTDDNGGALRFGNAIENGTVIASFENNSALNGGAVYFTQNGSISFSTFASNCATYDGGGVFFGNGGILDYSTFISNHADRGGAALSVGALNNVSNTFILNTANDGNDIKLLGGADSELSVSAENITIGEPLLIEVHMNETYSGEITIMINGSQIIMFGNENSVSSLGVGSEDKIFSLSIENGYGKLIIDDLPIGNYTANAIFKGNDIFKGSVASVDFEIYPKVFYDPDLRIEVENITERDKVFAVIHSNNTLSGVLGFKLNNSDVIYPVSIVNGYGNITLDELLAPGDYRATVIFNGDDTFYPSEASTNFTVSEYHEYLDPNFNMSVADIIVGDNVSVRITANESFKGYAYLIFNNSDAKHNVLIIYGEGHREFAGFDIGNYTVTLIYEGSEEYSWLPCEISRSFEVREGPKIDPGLRIEVNNVTADMPVVFDVYMNETFSGEVSVKLNGSHVIYPVDIIDGHGNTSISLAFGRYIATAVFDGNEIFNNSTASQEFEVYALDPGLRIEVNNVTADMPVVIDVYMNEIYSGIVSLKLNNSDEVFSVSIQNGYGNWTFYDLPVGTYIAAAIFDGNDIFYNSSASQEFEVFALNPDLRISVSNLTYGESAIVEISLNPALNKVSIQIGENGSAIELNIYNGYLRFLIDGLSVGNYTIFARTNATDIFINASVSANFEVKKANPNLEISVSNITVGQKAIVSIRVNSAFSGNVHLNIASKNYIIPIVNGKGSISISGLKVGSYIAKASVDETECFIASSKSASFKVKDHVIKLVLQKAEIAKFAPKAVIKATLYIDSKLAKNKKLTFTFKGKKYTAKTNGKGLASKIIKNSILKKLKVGQKLTYSVSYANKIVKRTVKVTKHLYQLSLQKIKVKRSLKKLIIKSRLKINGKLAKYKRLKFTFNGKSYSAKTNSKGLARIVIQRNVLIKLKAGSNLIYTVNYNTKTVKRNIKVL